MLCLLALTSAAPAPRATYPTAGTNELTAGGGGSCTYVYTEHDGSPVVTSASCTITKDDLDRGCDTDQTTRDYARALGGHDGVDDDDAGHILANRLGGNGEEPTNIFPQVLIKHITTLTARVQPPHPTAPSRPSPTGAARQPRALARLRGRSVRLHRRRQRRACHPQLGL